MEYYYSKPCIIVSTTLFLVFSSSSFLRLGLSQQLQNPRLALGDMPCVEKLAPCEPYVKRPGTASGTPPDTCCLPLKDMIADDSDCLCNVFNSPEVLQSMNATRDDAMKLPKSCGLDADVSKCNQGGGNQTAAHTAKSASSTKMTITPFCLVLTLFASLFSTLISGFN